MSVTSILSYYNKDYKDFRTLLSQEVPTPNLTKQFNLVRYNYMNVQTQIKKGEKPRLLAPCHSNNYTIVGTAFDYYIRFNIEKDYKNVISTKWVAEMATEQLKDLVENNHYLHKYKKLLKEIYERLHEIKEIHAKYISGKYLDINTILDSCLFLAKLDPLYRGVANPIDVLFMANVIEENDLKDLLGIISICDINYFKPKGIILLNPTFRKASKLIGGADADLIIDKKLIDIKVTKEFKLLRPYLNQLICYYLLSMIGGIDNADNIQIDELGVYFARYNFLWTAKVDQLAKPEQFEKMKDMLKQKINYR